MSLKKKEILLFVLALVILLVPVFAFTGTVLAQCSGDDCNIPNPLGTDAGSQDPRIIIGRIIAGVLGIVGSLALAIFVYGGVTWMISGGNQNKVQKGKDMILWAVLGLAIIFLSYALVTFIISAFYKGGVTGQDQDTGQVQILPN